MKKLVFFMSLSYVIPLFCLEYPSRTEIICPQYSQPREVIPKSRLKLAQELLCSSPDYWTLPLRVIMYSTVMNLIMPASSDETIFSVRNSFPLMVQASDLFATCYIFARKLAELEKLQKELEGYGMTGICPTYEKNAQHWPNLIKKHVVFVPEKKS